MILLVGFKLEKRQGHCYSATCMFSYGGFVRCVLVSRLTSKRTLISLGRGLAAGERWSREQRGRTPAKPTRMMFLAPGEDGSLQKAAVGATIAAVDEEDEGREIDARWRWWPVRPFVCPSSSAAAAGNRRRSVLLEELSPSAYYLDRWMRQLLLQ